MRVLLALFILTMTGCTGSDDAATAPAAEGDPDAPTPASSGPDLLATGIPWEIHDCAFVYSNALADAGAVQASLPQGFTVQTGPGGRASIGFETNLCDAGTTLNGSISPQTYATIWVGVTPPAGLRSESGAFHVVNFDVLIQDEARRAWMQERGIPAHDGSIIATTVGAAQRVELVLGEWEFAFNIGQLTEISNGGGTFDQWTPGDGLTYWRTDWATTQQSQAAGTIEIDPDSRYAAWFETPLIPAQFNVGTWDYTDGVILHPAPAS